MQSACQRPSVARQAALVSAGLKFDRAVKALLVFPVTVQQARRATGGTGEVNTAPI